MHTTTTSTTSILVRRTLPKVSACTECTPPTVPVSVPLASFDVLCDLDITVYIFFLVIILKIILFVLLLFQFNPENGSAAFPPASFDSDDDLDALKRLRIPSESPPEAFLPKTFGRLATTFPIRSFAA